MKQFIVIKYFKVLYIFGKDVLNIMSSKKTPREKLEAAYEFIHKSQPPKEFKMPYLIQKKSKLARINRKYEC